MWRNTSMLSNNRKIGSLIYVIQNVKSVCFRFKSVQHATTYLDRTAVVGFICPLCCLFLSQKAVVWQRQHREPSPPLQRVLHVRVFGFGWCSVTLRAVVGKGGKANEAGHESQRRFEAHGFAEKQARDEYGHHSPQTIERRVVQYRQFTEHIG